jgi:hypothetical protein
VSNSSSIAKPAQGYGKGRDKAPTVTDLVCGQSLTRKRHQFHPVILARSIELAFLVRFQQAGTILKNEFILKKFILVLKHLPQKRQNPANSLQFPTF